MKVSLRQKRRAKGERLQRMYAMQARFISWRQLISTASVDSESEEIAGHLQMIYECNNNTPLSFWQRFLIWVGLRRFANA